MPTGYGRQKHADEITAPLNTLIELYASQSELLGSLSSQMAKVVSVLERLSGHIGERLGEAHCRLQPVDAAASYMWPRSILPSDEPVPPEPTSDQAEDAESLIDVVFPERAYGAPYSPQSSMAAPISLPDAEIRRAQCGNVVLAVGSGYTAYSADGGTTLTALNPATTFPHRSGGGSCCNQAAQYLPGIDRFVWLMHFNVGTNGLACLRIAAASPREIVCTKCTGWTYWDLSTAQPGLNKGMNQPEISVRQNSLSVSLAQAEAEPTVIEIPLDAIRAGGPVRWRLSTRFDSAHSCADRVHSVTG
jgi:hypothetical protein